MDINDLIYPFLNTKINFHFKISTLCSDSRKIKTNSIFFAYPGYTTDGRLFMFEAINSGAKIIIYEENNLPFNLNIPTCIPCIPMRAIKEKLPSIAEKFYNTFIKKITIVGITGTNAKTTIAHNLTEAYNYLGMPSAYIGTLGYGKINNLSVSINTTPDVLDIYNMLYEFYIQDIKTVCMEVSSHALSQNRLGNINFSKAIYTNLSHDHLDYHKTMKNYALSKSLLFKRSNLEFAIINQDDSYSDVIKKSINTKTCKVISYGLHSNANITARNIKYDLNCTIFEINSKYGRKRFSIKSLGIFNIYNSLAIISTLLVSGYSLDEIIIILNNINTVPGRMEIIHDNPYIVIDYAHNPCALQNVLSTLYTIKKRKLIIVFGCGGNRDTYKRPIMGRIAEKYSDVIIITSDNPRNEDNNKIMDSIRSGINNKKNVFCIHDRKSAIIMAINIAEKDDIILIAGKGNECYQQIGNNYFFFSDKEIIKNNI